METLDTKSLRGLEWSKFAATVGTHIEEYTVPQYGDMGNDQATDFTLDDIKTNMMRYINRMGRNARGITEAKRDVLKLAHYACMANALLNKEEANEDKHSCS